MLHPAAVLAEVDRMSETPLWPGFEPRQTPLALFDGERTWLCRHPAPPAGFRPAQGDSIYVYEGRHPAMLGHTAGILGEVPTGLILLGAPGAESPADAACTAIHEAFHAFQARQFPGWGANEAELLTYPVEDAKALQLRRLETEALRRALEAADPRESLGWAGAALELHRERLDRLPPGSGQYENGVETLEGTALYVELKARGDRAHHLPAIAAPFPIGAVRRQCYYTGRAVALLLDRHASGWQQALAARDFLFPIEILAAVVSEPLAFSYEEVRTAEIQAERDVMDLRLERARRRAEFFAQPGRTLIVEAGEAPLSPRGFDPMNLEQLDGLEVLHTRMVRLGNEAGQMEVWGKAALTLGAGNHPLLQGIARATVAGLGPLEIHETPDRVTVTGDGIAATFRLGSAERSACGVTIRL